MRVDLIKFVEKYHSVGEQSFYRFLLAEAISKIVKMKNGEYKGNPELEFLKCSDKFLILFRQEGEEDHLTISKIFRKAGHKIYRLLLKRGLTNKNNKFLNLVG